MKLRPFAQAVMRPCAFCQVEIFLAVILIAVSPTPWLEAFDLHVAHFFFNAETGEWLVPSGRPPIWYFLYRAPKALLILISLLFLSGFVASFYTRKLKPYRVALVLSVLALGLIPGLIVILKHATDIYCPIQTTLFGGSFPRAGLFESYPVDLYRSKHGECWPAAHASAGFALMGISAFADKSDWKRRALLSAPGFVLGWVMGMFQVARGYHYFSHTVASLGIALLVIWVLKLISQPEASRARSPSLLRSVS